MSLVIETEEDWNTLMSDKTMTFVVDFTATWCGPCKAIGPYFEELSMRPEYARLAFLKVDVDKLPEVAQVGNVSSMPTFQVWKAGEAVLEMVGANKDKLIGLLDAALARV